MSAARLGRRYERQTSEDYLSKMLQEDFLNLKAHYNKFQTFLDLKDETVFGAFRRKLEGFVDQQNFKWNEMESDDPKKRNACATRFAAQVGDEYWGEDPEKRAKYLTASDDYGDTCRWSQNKQP